MKDLLESIGRLVGGVLLCGAMLFLIMADVASWILGLTSQQMIIAYIGSLVLVVVMFRIFSK